MLSQVQDLSDAVFQRKGLPTPSQARYRVGSGESLSSERLKIQSSQLVFQGYISYIQSLRAAFGIQHLQLARVHDPFKNDFGSVR